MIWFNNEIPLEVKDYISGVNVAFLLMTDDFMKESSEKETEKNKTFDYCVKCEEKDAFNSLSSAILAKVHVVCTVKPQIL